MIAPSRRARFIALALAVVLPNRANAQPYAKWYLAEGATGAYFEEEILVANPNTAPADVKITYLKPTGAPIVQTLTMKPTSRTTVRVNSIGGLEDTAVSAVVECTNGLDIVVERSMYWSATRKNGGHNSPGVTATALRWFLAEGATGFFDDFILIANPDAAATANVNVTYLKDDGSPPIVQQHQIGPNTRFNIWANTSVPGLSNASFSTVVEVTNNVGVIVERAMYFPTPTWDGGHESIGVTATSPTWRFAEGFTGTGFNGALQFETFLLLANPNPTDAVVRGTYFLASGPPIIRPYTVRANSRMTIHANTVPGLQNTSFSSLFESTNGIGIVAERAMYWGVTGLGASGWLDAHNTPGVTVEAARWAFAEGQADSLFDTYILVVNSGVAPLPIHVTFMREDGTGITRDFVVSPQSRFNIFPESYEALQNHRFATFVESTNGASFVAERAMYWGDLYGGGHGSVGTPWTGAIGTPPLPPPPTVTGITPTTGPSSGQTTVTITGTEFAQTATVTFGGVPASAVTVLSATTLTAVTPIHAVGSVDVNVTTNGTSLTLASAFTFAGPSISTVSPARGSSLGGTTVQITGSNLSGATVTFAGTAAVGVTVNSPTSVTAIAPAHVVGPATIRVTVPGGSFATATFTYDPYTSTDTILAFGDSITAGVTADVLNLLTIFLTRSTFTTGYPALLQPALQSRYSNQNITVQAAGVPGEYACIDGQNRLTTTLSPAHDLLILLQGVNDIGLGRSAATIEGCLRSMVQFAKNRGKKVIVTTLLPVYADSTSGMFKTDPAIVQQVNARIRGMAAAEQVVLVDMFNLFGSNQSYISADGLHPTPAGYQKMAQEYYNAIINRWETVPDAPPPDSMQWTATALPSVDWGFGALDVALKP